MGFLGWIEVAVESVKSFKIRKTCTEFINLAMVIAAALIVWKGLMCVSGTESPVVVIISGSMEPSFKRGDVLFLTMSNDPIRAGEIVVFKIDGQLIPAVHRVIKVHEKPDSGEINILTKGDNNDEDDRTGSIYAEGQRWLEQRHITGRAVGFAPSLGWVTIIMTDKPYVKYILLGAFGLFALT